MRAFAHCAVTIIAAACASVAEAQLPPATLTAPGAPGVFRENPNGPLTDRDIEIVAKYTTYSAPLSGEPATAVDRRKASLFDPPAIRHEDAWDTRDREFQRALEKDNSSRLPQALEKAAFAQSLKANNLSFVDSITTNKGFQAILVKDNATGRVVMSVRGTETGLSLEAGRDIHADAAPGATISTGQAHPGLTQYDAEVKKWVAEKMAEHKGNIVVTGHSLGGAHTQRIALDHADQIVAARTYNAPALETTAIERTVNDPRQMAKLFDDKGRPKVKHFVGGGDAVSAAGSLHIPGDVVLGIGGPFDTAGLGEAHSLIINDPAVTRIQMTTEEYQRIRTAVQSNASSVVTSSIEAVIGITRGMTELHPALLWNQAAGELTASDIGEKTTQVRKMIEKAAQLREKKAELNERDKAKVELAKEKAQREDADRKKTIDAVMAETKGAGTGEGTELKTTLERRAEQGRMEAAERKKARERKQAKERSDQAALLALADKAKKDLDLPPAAAPNLPPLVPPPPPTPQEIAEVVAAFQAAQQQEAKRQQALAAAMASFATSLGHALSTPSRKSRSKPAGASPPAPSAPAGPSKPPASCCCGRC